MTTWICKVCSNPCYLTVKGRAQENLMPSTCPFKFGEPRWMRMVKA